MALRMARPWKDPKTGTYHLRQRPPRDLIARVTGTRVLLPIGARPVLVTVGAVVQTSLRTKTIADAKARHSEADAGLKRYWDAVRVGQRALTHKEAVALAGEFYRAAMQCIENDQSRSLPRVLAEANHKRTYRIYRDGGLSIRSKRPKRKRARRYRQGDRRSADPTRSGRWTSCPAAASTAVRSGSRPSSMATRERRAHTGREPTSAPSR